VNLARASQRAVTVPGRKSAARLYNDIEYELALGEPDEPLETIGEHALALLEDRFPGVRQAAREIEQPPSLSRRAANGLHGIGTRPPRRPSRSTVQHGQRRWGRSRSWLLANARAHPVATIATVTALTFVVVHVWVYMALTVIAIAALKASHARQR
jgi:hypothetical protein